MNNHLIHSKHRKSPHRSDWYTLWPMWTVCAFFLLLLVFGIVREYVTDLPKKSDVPMVILGNDRDLHLDPATLRPSELHLFEASASGRKVKFIVERTKNNTIHVALASCRTCYRSHDLHYVRKGQMICGECNVPMAFESKDGKAIRNNCALAKVPHTETNRDVTVLARDVIAQAAKLPQ